MPRSIAGITGRIPASVSNAKASVIRAVGIQTAMVPREANVHLTVESPLLDQTHERICGMPHDDETVPSLDFLHQPHHRHCEGCDGVYFYGVCL